MNDAGSLQIDSGEVCKWRQFWCSAVRRPM